MGAARTFRTRVGLDWGSLVHVAFGFLAALLGFEWLAALLFLAKQLLDVYGGEDTAEASGDIAEFCAGLALGKLYLLVVGV